MKKIFLSLLTIFMVLSLSVVLVKASESTTVSLEDGVQIRTDGNNGLKWVANVANHKEGNEYGFLFAQGDLDEVTIETNGVVNKVVEGVTDEELTMAATMVNFPKSAATQDISVVAYVKADDVYTYSNVVVRNLSEVAVQAYENGIATGDFVEAVYDASETTFNLNGGAFVADYSFKVTRYNVGGNTGYYIGMSPSSNPSGATGLYWDRILVKYDESKGAYKVVAIRASGVSIGSVDYDYIIGGHNSCYDAASKKVVSTFVSKGDAALNYYLNFEVPTTSTCDVNIQLFEDYELLGSKYHFGGGEDLPDVSKTAYDFLGWCANEDLSDTPVLKQGTDRTLYAKFAPTEYEISYELNGGNCSANLVTRYNVETATFALPTASEMTIGEGKFAGWYDNETFSGNPVTEISLGSYGDKTLYAKWIMDVPTEVELSAADEAVFAQVTPTIVVNSTFSSGKYSIDGIIYEAGVSAVSSIASALSIAQENDIIYVFAGVYDEALTVSTTNLTIVGPNYNILGTATRNAEANVTALTSIAAKNVTINGLKFTSSGAIKVSADDVTITNIYMSVTSIKMYANNRKGCIVNGIDNSVDYLSNLVISNSYINDTSSASSAATAGFLAFDYIENLTLDNNYFTNTNRTVEGGNEGMMTYYMYGTLNIKNNTFDYTTDGYLLRLGYNKNACTEINIIDNVFTGGPVDHTASIYILRGTSALTTNIIGNTFDEFYGTTFAYSNDTGSKVNIMYNYFTTTCKFKSGSIPSNTKVTYSNNYYATTQTTATSDYGVITSKDALDAAYQEYLATLE